MTNSRLKDLTKAYLKYTKSPTEIYIMLNDNEHLQTQLILKLVKINKQFKADFTKICSKWANSTGGK